MSVDLYRKMCYTIRNKQNRQAGQGVSSTLTLTGKSEASMPTAIIAEPVQTIIPAACAFGKLLG
jgi:hypothetical protein